MTPEEQAAFDALKKRADDAEAAAKAKPDGKFVPLTEFEEFKRKVSSKIFDKEAEGTTDGTQTEGRKPAGKSGGFRLSAPWEWPGILRSGK